MANLLAKNGIGDNVYVKAIGSGSDLDPLVTVHIPYRANYATPGNVSASITNVTIAAGNANRIGLLLYNDSDSPLYIKYGATASLTSFTVKIPAQGYWEMPNPVYVGIIDGIWPSANGAVRKTELT